VDGDLIFDSTAEGLIQVKATGTVLVPNSTDPNQQFAGIVIIHTGIPTHFDDGSSHTLTWSTLLDPSTSNVSPVFTAEDSLVTTNFRHDSRIYIDRVSLVKHSNQSSISNCCVC